MLAQPAQQPLPDLHADDKALVRRFIECRGDFAAMAASLADKPVPDAPNWTILDLYAWSLTERIAAWIAFHHSQDAASLKRAALDLLLKVADATTDLVEKRRAATTILRALAQPTRPRRTDPGSVLPACPTHDRTDKARSDTDRSTPPHISSPPYHNGAASRLASASGCVPDALSLVPSSFSTSKRAAASSWFAPANQLTDATKSRSPPTPAANARHPR